MNKTIITSSYKIVVLTHSYKIAYAQDLLTGKFVKHSLAKAEMNSTTQAKIDTITALFICFVSIIFGGIYLASGEIEIIFIGWFISVLIICLLQLLKKVYRMNDNVNKYNIEQSEKQTC